jgi:hypothetical protein
MMVMVLEEAITGDSMNEMEEAELMTNKKWKIEP